MPRLATAVYLLCLGASSACAILLVRSFLQNRSRLLLYSGACFVLLAINNLLVVLDLVILPGVDLSGWRNAASFVAVSILLYGFIWEVD